jgi:methionyl-tRNA formyltransferase
VSEPQNERDVTVCRRLSKGDGEILWSLPSEMIERMVRAFIPWPKAYTYWNGRRLSVLESHLVTPERVESNRSEQAVGSVAGMDREEGILVQTGRGMLGITKLQLEGKKPLHWEQFLNGNRDFLHARLGVNE